MKKIALFVVLGLLVVAGVIGAYVMRPSAEASSPIQATPVQANSNPTQKPEAQKTGSEPTATIAPAMPESAGMGGQVVYQIVQDESKVTFSIDEVLRGSPFTAVGETNQVAGEIAVDFDNATVQVGTVQVNARTLRTDSNFRDRAIRNEILDTDAYEMITFTPRMISGLPQSANPGDVISFSIRGDLTIRDITQEVTFTGQVELASLDRLEGTAEATVKRSDYKLVIPSVPSVADVSDEVLVKIQFVAAKK